MSYLKNCKKTCRQESFFNSERFFYAHFVTSFKKVSENLSKAISETFDYRDYKPCLLSWRLQRLFKTAGQSILEYFIILVVLALVTAWGISAFLGQARDSADSIFKTGLAHLAGGLSTIDIVIKKQNGGNVLWQGAWAIATQDPGFAPCNMDCLAPRYSQRLCWDSNAKLGMTVSYTVDQLCYWYGICLCCGEETYGMYDVFLTEKSTRKSLGQFQLGIFGCQDNPSTGVCGFMYNTPCGG